MTAYITLPRLQQEAFNTLFGVSREVEFKTATSYRRRMGENRAAALSIYDASRWFDWTHAHRQAFRLQFPERVADKSVAGHFLRLPPETGFLDRQTTWVGKTMAATIFAYALKGDQELLLDDEPVLVRRGCGVGFSLRQVHEIKPSVDGQLWACAMVLHAPQDLV